MFCLKEFRRIAMLDRVRNFTRAVRSSNEAAGRHGVAWRGHVGAGRTRATSAASLHRLTCCGATRTGRHGPKFGRGYVDGATARLEERFAEGRLERLPEFASELVNLPVHVIVAVAAWQATATIPIVMVHVGDPIGYR